MQRLRTAIERSRAFDALCRGLGRVLGGYFRLCQATCDLRMEGLQDVRDALKDGPVVVVGWHGRQPSLLYSWSDDMGPCVTLTDPSPIGRAGAAAQRCFAMSPISMPASAPAASIAKEVFRALRSGQSLALTADGPLGPNREANESVAAWIKKGKRPVFHANWSVRPAVALSSWDRFLFPFPFGRGVIRYHRFTPSRDVQKMSFDEIRAELTDALMQAERALDQEIRG